MSTNEAQWINPDQQLPTPQEAKDGIWVWNSFPNTASDGFVELVRYAVGVYDPFKSVSRTRWKPAKDDIPAPPKEPTQRERDEIAFSVFYGTHPGLPSCRGDDREKMWMMALGAWHNALAHERAWFRAELEKMTQQDAVFRAGASDALIRMTDRCREGAP